VSQPVASKPQYANWVSTKLVVAPFVLAVLLGGLSALSLWFAAPAVLVFVCAGYFAYARWKFSASGGDIQSKVQGLVLGRLNWRGGGEVLDIGCGAGALAVAIAKAHPAAHVVGVDRWGSAWEFSKAACERNAAAEGVSERVAFQPASAAALPFAVGAFDIVVSNLVFHEVRDVADKRLLLKEALRVLKKGGIFVFQDLFLWRRIYGDVDDLIGAIEGWGIAEAHFSPTNAAPFLPSALKLPFMLGAIGIIDGVK
jgi:SAM-dependent methyltransferase